MADFDSWDIAGYGGDGEWFDVENGAVPLENISPDIDEIVVHYFDAESGDHAYVTIWGPWDDWDSLEDIIDTIDPDPYSGE